MDRGRKQITGKNRNTGEWTGERRGEGIGMQGR